MDHIDLIDPIDDRLFLQVNSPSGPSGPHGPPKCLSVSNLQKRKPQTDGVVWGNWEAAVWTGGTGHPLYPRTGKKKWFRCGGSSIITPLKGSSEPVKNLSDGLSCIYYSTNFINVKMNYNKIYKQKILRNILDKNRKICILFMIKWINYFWGINRVCKKKLRCSR